MDEHPTAGPHGTPSNGNTGNSDRPRDRRQLSQLFEKLPPHAVEAEMSLLGSMLIDPQVIGDVILILHGGDDFYKPANGSLYDAMVELYDQRAALDIVQLHRLLADRDVLDAVGGLDYLVELANAAPTAAHAAHYAREVRNKAAVRHLIEAAGDILYDAYHSSENAGALLEAAEQRIFEIAQHGEAGSAEALHDLLLQAMETIQENTGKDITGVPTGFIELTEMTSGFQPGEMIILAARPSMGKTALALNITEEMALRGHGVAVFSLEMSRSQLVQRLLASRSGVSSQKIRRAMLQNDEFPKLQRACAELLDAPIFIDDTAGLTLLQLRAKGRRLVARHEIKAVVIDYLQLMSAGGRPESRQLEISEISRGVKAMARELNLPVICLSQLNRGPEQREGHRPRMSDLRESGSLEQDADVVMMLHREDYYHKGEEDYEPSHVAELILAKQRNGPTGSIKLTWVEQTTRFRDYSPAVPTGSYVESKQQNYRSAGGHSASVAFTSTEKTGPVADFRDGGGPGRQEEEAIDDLPI